MNRPAVWFAVGTTYGALVSFSISFGPLIALVLFGSIPFLAWSARQVTLLAGGLFGWGITWLVVIGSGYLRCQAMGPDCIGGESMLPFAALGGLLAVAGLAVVAIGHSRHRLGAPTKS